MTTNATQNAQRSPEGFYKAQQAARGKAVGDYPCFVIENSARNVAHPMGEFFEGTSPEQ
jgi:hypothetical protein